MSTSFLPTWLYNDQKIFELELDKYLKNYWHPLIFIGEIKPGKMLEKNKKTTDNLRSPGTLGASGPTV